MAFPTVEEGVTLIEAARAGRELSEREALRLVAYIKPDRFGQEYERSMTAGDWAACWAAIAKAADVAPADTPEAEAAPAP